MADKSGWKESEAKAARLFPGGKRRTRIGGTRYDLVADDVIWGPEYFQEKPLRVIKICMRADESVCADSKHRCVLPVYVEVKKSNRISGATTLLREAEKKYIPKGTGGRVILIQHGKGEKRQFVTIADSFFKELIEAWCRERRLFLDRIPKSRS